MNVFLEVISGILKGLTYGGMASVAVIFLSLIFRYFTDEKFPLLMGIALGLGLLGIGGGLTAILDQPTTGGVVEIILASIIIVWGVNAGDRLASRIPKRGKPLLGLLMTKKTRYITIKLPHRRLIHDISGKPRLPSDLKADLSEREFLLPADLPPEELAERLKRRLITDWGVGEVELELDEGGKVIYLAVAAKEHGISETIPSGNVAVPVKCSRMPSGLAPGDFVRIYLEDGEVIDRLEVKGVEKEEKEITIVTSLDVFERLREKKASMVIALSSMKPVSLSVKKRSGNIERFKVDKIISSVKKAGASDERTEEVVKKIEERFLKAPMPVSTKEIKEAVIEELKETSPKVAENYRQFRKPEYDHSSHT